MASQPVLKRQIFISYAHADDRSIEKGVPGWVSLFVEKLEIVLARHTGGSTVGIWMDHQLEPQRRVNDELRSRIGESAVFLAFMSPGYLESEWCKKELDTFVEVVGSGSSANRVFLIGVLPTERDDWHEAVHELSEVKFWERTLTYPEPQTMGWPVPDPRRDREYWDGVNALASILARQLDELDGVGRSATVPRSESPSHATSPAPLPAPLVAKPSVAAPLNIVLHAAEEEDRQLVAATRDMLNELDTDAYLAPALGARQTPAQHRAEVEQLLRESHGVLVVYGLAPPSWVQSKHTEARKVLSRERQGTWAGLIEGPPEPKLPHGLPERGLMVLDWRNGYRKDELNRFLEALRQRQGGGNSHV